MSESVATLGLAVDSSDVVAATSDLDRLTAAAKNTETTTQRVGRAMDGTASGIKAVGAAASSAASASAQFEKASRAVQVANDNAAKSIGLARYELINLSRQVQDVAVSLAGGQSPLTVLFQQGSQIGDVFASSKASVGDFAAQAKTYLGGFLTAGRVAFGGVALAITGAAFALNSYLDSQQKVQMSLLGAGRASGQSVGSINGVASSSSSLTGLSVSEARAFAAELASVGKIGKDNLEPLVKIGHDIATVFGVSAADAAKMLGAAFADPVRGADQLNERLGFLDATMQRQIANLVAQGRLWEAQTVLQSGVTSSLAGVSDAVATSTKFWTALGNVVSNVWDKIGAAASRATGIGFTKGLDEQLDEAKARLEALSKTPTTSLFGFFKMEVPVTEQDLQQLRLAQAEVDKLTAAMQRNAQATADAQARQRTFAQEAVVRSTLPDVSQLENLKNSAILLEGAISDTKTAIANIIPDEFASTRLKQLTDALGQFVRALDVTKSSARELKTEFQSSMESLKIANDAVTAFSPAAKAEIAKRQSLLSTDRSTLTGSERATVAEQTYLNVLKQSNVALSEQARARALSAQQAIDSAELEIKLVGKSIGQQAELRANLQAKQALEQQASQNRTGFDNSEYERLKKLNAELGKTAQLVALTQIRDQIKEDRQTIGFSQEDLQIAQALKQTYPEITERMNSAEAAQMRLNNTLRSMDQIQRDAFGDFLQNMRQGKSFADSLTAAFGSMADKLAKIGSDKLFDGLKSGDISKAFSVNVTGATSDGIVEGFQAIQDKAAAARANPSNSFSFNGSGNAAAAGIGAVGSAVGIFGQSKQQTAAGGTVGGAALSGALSGALAGAALGSIVPGIGTLVGGAIGLVGGAIMGWFGGNSGAQQAAEKAAADWAAVKVQASDFANVLNGGGTGSLTSGFTQAKTQMQQFADTAQKAGDTDAVVKLNAAYDEFVRRTSQAFRDSFAGIVDALNSGLGPNSPFASAAANVKTIGDQVKGFIDDVRLAFDADPVARAGGSSTSATDVGGAKEGSRLLSAFSQDNSVSASAITQVQAATAAAQEYLLSLLGQAPVLSDAATAVQHLAGTAAQLQTTLVDLGMSSEQAAQAINTGVVAAMGQLAATFTNGLEREINAALGQDYLNSTADLVARRTTALSDAALLGTGTQLIDRWFSVSAQKLIDDARLTGAAFDALTARFPELQGAVHAFVDQAAIDTAAAKAASDAKAAADKAIADAQAAQQARLQQAQAQLSTALNDLGSAQSGVTSAYQAQANLFKSTASAALQAADSIKKFRDSLLINTAYTNLNPLQQYQEAQRQFRSVSAQAATGDATALGQLQGVSQAYLDASKSYYASSEQYFADFAEVQGILSSSEIAARAQVDVATAQLNALNSQVSGLVAIKDIITIGDANIATTIAAGSAAVTAAIGALQVAQANVAAAQANLNATRDYGVRPEVNKYIQSGLDAAGISYTGNYGASSGFQEWVNSQTQSVQDQIYAIAHSVPDSIMSKYADGTDFARGGLSMVGERGPEIMNVPRGAQIIPNDVMRGMQRGSNDNRSGISRGDLESLGRMIVDAIGISNESLKRLLNVQEEAPAKNANAQRRVVEQTKKRA